MFTTALAGMCQALFARLTLIHLAATLLLAASALANFKYGMSLGATALEGMIAGMASVGADLWNAVGLIAVAWAAKNRLWGQATAAGLVLACTLLYSINAGIGFAAGTKEDIIGQRAAELRADKAVQAELRRIDDRLTELGPTGPSAEHQAKAAAILANPRAEGCKTLNGAYTKTHCPTYFKHVADKAKAEERERLIAERGPLAAKIQQTQTVAVADPTGSTVVKYLAMLWITTTPEDVRSWQTLLFVVLVVLGGPVGLWLAESRLEARYPHFRKTADNDNKTNVTEPLQSVPSGPEIEATVTEPLLPPLPVVRQRKLEPVTPAGDAALKKLRTSGGKVTAKSNAQLANKLKIPRTSFRRVIDRLEASGMIETSHGPDGYTVRIAA